MNDNIVPQKYPPICCWCLNCINMLRVGVVVQHVESKTQTLELQFNIMLKVRI